MARLKPPGVPPRRPQPPLVVLLRRSPDRHPRQIQRSLPPRAARPATEKCRERRARLSNNDLQRMTRPQHEPRRPTEIPGSGSRLARFMDAGGKFTAAMMAVVVLLVGSTMLLAES